ncbi:MAG: Tetratricopeptide 2 repeat protein [Hyphomicrobiales bacterium]|nr:Tetratricopeptide 2 repeat protein [Hyphomicrobiales bacterium]
MPDIGLGLSPGAPTAVVQAPQDEGTAAEKGRAQFAHANFGLAERYFREAVEREAGDVDSWIGLGASYDQLKRFDLADRAYENAIRIGGRLPGILNNQGYSYFLRGDHRRARALLKEALRGDPTSQAIQSNLSRLGAL